MSFNVTGLVQEWVSSPAGNRGLLLRPTLPSNNMTMTYRFASLDHWDPAWRPKLVVTYTSGGQAHSSTGRVSGHASLALQRAPEATPPANHTWRSYYQAAGRRVAMRVQDGTTGANQVHYLFADHLGSTHGTYNTANGSSTAQRYYPWGSVRSGPNNALPTGYTFTGQLDSGLGLMYYGARFYDGALGRFLQPDTIVPEPGNPQALNRYSYVLNNPVRYTDSTGMFSEDQIMASLIDQYGAKEATRIWNLWLLDAAWMNALYEADFGSDIWASQMGHGRFDQASQGSPRIVIRPINSTDSDLPVDLWQFQGKGGYQVSSQNHVVRENSCHVSACFQPIFNYDSQGRIIGDEPVRWVHSAWAQPLFGMNPFWYAEGSTAIRAPWKFTDNYGEETFGTVLGWFVPIIDIGQDLEGMLSPIFPLTVASIPYPGADGGFMNPIHLPKAFRP